MRRPFHSPPGAAFGRAARASAVARASGAPVDEAREQVPGPGAGEDRRFDRRTLLKGAGAATGAAAALPRAGTGRRRLRSQPRIAIVGGFSPLGARVQVATNLNSFLDLRASGNYFDYSTNFTVDGISANARAALSSAGASLDVYPFHNGFRVSGGALFYNQNRLTATAAVPSGTSFKLNGDTFYSATANATTGATPISGNAYLSLHAIRPAFTVTAGWGNIIPRDGGHWSFPHEIGVAVIGAPTVDVNLGGFVCLDQTQAYCYNFATAPEAAPARADLQTQVAKWTKDLAPLKVYPIISFGIAYNFRIR